MEVGVTVAVCLPTVLTPRKSKLRPSLSLHPANSSYYGALLGVRVNNMHQTESSLVHQTTHSASYRFPLAPFTWGMDVSLSRKWTPESWWRYRHLENPLTTPSSQRSLVDLPQGSEWDSNTRIRRQWRVGILEDFLEEENVENWAEKRVSLGQALYVDHDLYSS